MLRRLLRRLLELLEKLRKVVCTGVTCGAGVGTASGRDGFRAKVGSDRRRTDAGDAWMVRLEPPRKTRVSPWLLVDAVRLGSLIGAMVVRVLPVLSTR